jgi:hypothetical protein
VRVHKMAIYLTILVRFRGITPQEARFAASSRPVLPAVSPPPGMGPISMRLARSDSRGAHLDDTHPAPGHLDAPDQPARRLAAATR